MNHEVGRQCPHGRKGLTRLKLAGDKRLGRGEDHLFEDRLAGS
jgi:hypothetical protein